MTLDDNTASSAPGPDASASDAPSSPVNADTQAPASSSDTGDASATSPAAPADERTALLEIARNAVDANRPKTPQQGESQEAKPETSANPDQAAQADPVPEPDPTEDELKAAAPKTKARIEKLLRQRAEARNEAETLKPDAAKWQQMNEYLTRNDLAAEDVNLLLGVGAALRRGDFKAFLDGVRPYVDLAQQALGQAVPADLQSKVDAGELTDAAARELAMTRIQNARLQGTVEASQRQAQIAAQQDAEARAGAARQQAVLAWEQTMAQRDPDYARKAPMVLKYTQALIASHGMPQTPDQAVAMAKQAYEEAQAHLGGLRPTPQPTRPAPSGARSLNGARPEPKTMLEAAWQAAEDYRSRTH